MNSDTINESHLLRIELSPPADLSASSLQWAIETVYDSGTYGTKVIVHPYAKHLARYLSSLNGWRMPIEIDTAFGEEEWVVTGANGTEVHSFGA